MADASGVKLNAAVGGLGQLSIFRQIGVLVGLAASIALEGELAKTIGSISGVQSARVHLAIPKQTSFIRDRDRKMPSASVMLTLYAGRLFESGQVASIVNLVGSSVPGLSPDRVTVVDQAGRLLSSPGSANDLRLTATQFEYRKQLEDYYIKRIEEILTPILGHDGVRAQVSADMDFSVIEQTQESYNPDMPAIRSEQTSEDLSRWPGIDGGVPGALTNRPPRAGAGAGAGGAAPAAPAAGAQES